MTLAARDNPDGRFYICERGWLWDRTHMDEPVMCDSDRERDLHAPLHARARGRVLVFGLGIGFALPELLANPAVESVHIVELHQEVVDMVLPQLSLPARVTLELGDLHRYEPPRGLYDTIWIDPWTTPVEHAAYAAAGIATNHRDDPVHRLAPYLAAGGWVGCWAGEP